MSSRFSELLDRFFFRPDEAVGPFFELAPEGVRTATPAPEEVPEEFLAFVLEGETYAVPIVLVREILKVTDVTEIPRAQKQLLGLINVRGQMLPLYDLKVRLRLRDSAPVVRVGADVGRWARVLLLKSEEGDAGVLVDRVEGVVKLQLSRLEATPRMGLERNAVAGIARSHGSMFILLDVEQALS